MPCENCSDELRSVIRLQNRTLRTVNKSLRNKVIKLEQHSDDVFFALCETKPQAEEAFGELWGSALFDCGPEDYDYMVEVIKKAFAFIELHNGDGTQLVASIVNKDLGLTSDGDPSGLLR